MQQTLQEPAFVVAVDGDTVWVEVMQTSTCSRCSANKLCGHGVLQRGFAKQRSLCVPVFYEAAKAALLQVGQRVDIVMPANSVLIAAALAYGLPLLGLLLGAIALQSFLAGELAAIAGAIVGFVSALLMARRLSSRLRFHPRFRPVLLAAS